MYVYKKKWPGQKLTVKKRHIAESNKVHVRAKDIKKNEGLYGS